MTVIFVQPYWRDGLRLQYRRVAVYVIAPVFAAALAPRTTATAFAHAGFMVERQRSAPLRVTCCGGAAWRCGCFNILFGVVLRTTNV